MSDSPLDGTNAALTADDIAQLVEQATAKGKVVERLIYLETLDRFAIQCGHFGVLIERDFIDEFKGLLPTEMNQVTVSPSGATIELETHDIHIEVAGLLASYINHLRGSRARDALFELIEKERREMLAGIKFALSDKWQINDEPALPDDEPAAEPGNELEKFFFARSEGRGIWKWQHYFQVYDSFFRSFRGKQAHILEIGIYSGGSLDLWREYFGPEARIYGVDIQPECKVYENTGATIFIGDQQDRDFWTDFKRNVPQLDIVIDDGGHSPEQQRVTIEELLPHLRPGGVYICEDIHGEIFNSFACFTHGLAHSLNDSRTLVGDVRNGERRLRIEANPLQSCTHSIHFFPFMVVVRKNQRARRELVAPRKGTLWQPFLG
jgi:hypothetical protein